MFSKKKISKANLQRMLVSGSQPAQFYTMIKDHKEKNENNEYPLRPIASCIDNPTNKIDWFCGRILNQLVNFVPAHLPSSLKLIEELSEKKFSNITEDCIFLSLDVINLYPSLPIDSALKVVSEFSKKHWRDIDNFGISVQEFLNMMKFISYNYEVEFEKKVYLQVKGVPMGSHFAPPLAIIFLNHIEEQALNLLKSHIDMNKIIYKRFIDDSILGPLKKDKIVFDLIHESFNSINKDIKFTIEVPENGVLNFLDLSIWIDENKKITHQKYTKEISSGNTLKKDSWLPSSVKTNFVRQTLKDIDLRSSASLSENKRSLLREKCEHNLKANGYSEKDFRKCENKYSNYKKNKNKLNNKCTLKLPFVSDSLVRKINYFIRKYKLEINFVSKGNKTLRNALKIKSINRHEDCDLCDKLQNNYRCDDKCVVYQFTCKVCSEKYIGKTARPFDIRYKEHKNSIKNGNSISALSDHVKVCDVNCIDDFNVEILKRVCDPVEASLVEARFIDLSKPKLNRRHEIATACLMLKL